MRVKDWEAKLLRTDGAAKRVAEIEDELRLAAGLTALRERAGMTQRRPAMLCASRLMTGASPAAQPSRSAALA